MFFFFFFFKYYIYGLGLGRVCLIPGPDPNLFWVFFLNENPDPTLMLNRSGFGVGSGWAGYSRVGLILPSLIISS